jgi:vancomycin resistance protein YoaR
MPQRPPGPDETVRFRGDAPDARPRFDGARHSAGASRPPVEEPEAPPIESDDTRPVSRDWLQGAPHAHQPERGAPGAPVAPSSGEPTGAAARDTAGDDTPTGAIRDDVPARTAAAPVGPSADEDDYGTQKFDLIRPEPAAAPPATAPPEFAPRSGRTSGSLPPEDEPPLRGPRGPWWRRRAVLVPAGAVAVLAAAYGVDLAASQGSIPRSTVVAGVDIGGLSPAAAATALEQDLAPRVTADHTVVADDVEATLSPVTAGITLDVGRTIDAADDHPLNPWTRLVTLFGDRTVEAVITDEDTALNAQIETVAAQVDRAPEDATIRIQGTTPSVVDPADGRELDREGAAAAIIAALASGGDPGSPIELPVEVTPVNVGRAEAERVLDETVEPALSAPVTVVGDDGTSAEVPVAAIAASLVFIPEEDGELVISVDPRALQTALGDALSAFGTPAKDAEFAISGNTVSVVPSVDGTGVDPAELAEQLLPLLTSPAPRSVRAELGPVPAEFTTEEAQALGIKEEISSFTTRFTSPASGTNIRVVAAEVDGALIMPGETFSLNTFTGPRGRAQGYVEAAVIQNGELSKAVGGGISQFATTMFNAVFFAGLEDVFHKPHSFYISRYPAGREATVYEGAIDLVWRNDSDTGVYVDTAWTPGSLTVAFYGTERYEIQAIEGPRTNHREPTVQDKVDDGNCTPQSGIPGFDITVTRIFRDLRTGAELRRENFFTRYAAEAIINCIPPAEPSPTPATTTPGG